MLSNLSCRQALYASDIIPSESAVLNLVASHCELMSCSPKYSLGPSLRMLAYSAAKLMELGAAKLGTNEQLRDEVLDLVVPALVCGIFQRNIPTFFILERFMFF